MKSCAILKLKFSPFNSIWWQESEEATNRYRYPVLAICTQVLRHPYDITWGEMQRYYDAFSLKWSCWVRLLISTNLTKHISWFFPSPPNFLHLTLSTYLVDYGVLCPKSSCWGWCKFEWNVGTSPCLPGSWSALAERRNILPNMPDLFPAFSRLASWGWGEVFYSQHRNQEYSENLKNFKGGFSLLTNLL